MNPEDIETVKANVAKLVDAGASEQDIHDYIEAAGHPMGGTPLQGQMGKPITDASPEPPVDPRREAAEKAFAHVLNMAQGIPGMEALEAGAGMVGSRLSGEPLNYEQSLGALRSRTSEIGGKTAALERMVGTAPLLPFMPANAAVAGGLLGGANGLSGADPQSMAERAGHAALNAGLGAVAGRALETASISGRSLLASEPAKYVREQFATLTPKAVADWSATATPAERKLATDQILGVVKSQPKITRHLKVVPWSSPAITRARGLLEQVDPNDMLNKVPSYGLLALSALK